MQSLHLVIQIKNNYKKHNVKHLIKVGMGFAAALGQK